jgi:hypothetical protein
MSYFPCDIPYMSKEELETNSIRIPKDKKQEQSEMIQCEQLRELQRARTLLKATHDFLKAAKRNPYVEDVLSMLIYYDEAYDGYCLMDDIEKYFDEFVERRTDE